MRSILKAGACVLAVLALSRSVRADAATCAGIDRSNLIACVLRASPALQEQLAAERAVTGRREAARPFLPTNPTMAAAIASRRSASDRDTNWSLTVGQQLEVYGQRGLRLDVADSELRAQGHRVVATRARIAVEAWTQYFAVLALRERLILASRREDVTSGVAATVRAMAASGVASEIDADIAEAAAVKVTQRRLQAESALAGANAQLAVLTGGGDASGALEPIASVTHDAMVARPELLAVREQESVYARKAILLRRERLPNPTVSFTAQNDGFDERVLGVGLSLPIPLPGPLGRTFAGEIAEMSALAESARAGAEGLERTLRAELLTAVADLEAATQARALYDDARLTRLSARLEDLARQVKSGALPVRDALIAQQALVEQLEAAIDAREWLCVASVRLARATGASLEGSTL